MIQVPNEDFSRLLVSHPVLLMSTRSGRSNTLAPVTWYAPLSGRPPLIGVSLKPSSQSYQYLREAGDFILAIPNDQMLRAVHFCGVHSGRDMDKMYHLNFPVTRAREVSPLALSFGLGNVECRVRDIVYTTGDRPFVTGEVLSVTVDPQHYDEGWLPSAVMVYYLGGNRYRVGDEIVDLGAIRPGYVPPDAIL